jgi:hypothetical protein
MLHDPAHPVHRPVVLVFRGLHDCHIDAKFARTAILHPDRYDRTCPHALTYQEVEPKLLVLIALIAALFNGTHISTNDVGSGAPEVHGTVTWSVSPSDVGSGAPEHH